MYIFDIFIFFTESSTIFIIHLMMIYFMTFSMESLKKKRNLDMFVFEVHLWSTFVMSRTDA